MHPVVVIDDDEPNLQLYTALVERVLGGEARAYANPLDGLAAIAEYDPSLIVVDYQMPEMDGLELIRRIRTLPGRADTPIMMLTAANEGHLREAALRLGANAFMTKPFATVEFVRNVRHLGALHERANEGTIESPIDRDRDTIARLHRTLEAHDPHKARAIRRTRDVAIEIARALRLGTQSVETLRWVALVYDIGMLAVPENVLALPTALTAASRAVVNNHADVGASILSGSDSALLQAAEAVARHHHEYYDGTGYPSGLTGEAIPMLARIIAAADAFVAMTSERPHRHRISPDRAFAELRRCAGTQFDPTVIAAFERLRERLGAA